MKTNKWKITIELEVSPNWVFDGFDMNTDVRKDELHDSIVGMLPYAYEQEMNVKIDVKELIASNDLTAQKKEHGYL